MVTAPPTESVATARGNLRFDEPWHQGLRSSNPLGFSGYTAPDPEEESVRTGLVHAPRGDYVLIECSFGRASGTMGVAAGQTVVEAYERARGLGLPVAQVVSSGGARLQEGFYALAQMGRTTSAAAAHRQAGLRSATAFRSPTTGGVLASWAGTTDVRAGSPNALIGFGGPRVVETVTGSLPPSTSHTAEAALRDGHIDAVVPDTEHQEWLERALGIRAAPRLAPSSARPEAWSSTEDPWSDLLGVRQPSRPSGLDWAAWLTSEWTELGGGSRIRAGIARIGTVEAVVVAMDRDRSGAARPSLPVPADFRLARRAIAFADRLRLPLLTLVDTPGADPSPDSEREGLAREIAHTLLAMASLAGPSVALCVGEGGSGGAMALAHADSLFMLEGTVFAVIGPEAGAAVLYRDTSRAPDVARGMQISASDLARAGLVDGVLPPDVAAVRTAVRQALRPQNWGGRNRRPDRATLDALTGRRRGPAS